MKILNILECVTLILTTPVPPPIKLRQKHYSVEVAGKGSQVCTWFSVSSCCTRRDCLSLSLCIVFMSVSGFWKETESIGCRSLMMGIALCRYGGHIFMNLPIQMLISCKTPSPDRPEITSYQLVAQSSRHLKLTITGEPFTTLRWRVARSADWAGQASFSLWKEDRKV